MKKCLLFAVIAVLAVCVAAPVSAQEFYRVEGVPAGIEMDGYITEDEWGAPIFTTSPGACWESPLEGWDYWAFTPAPENQRVKIYVTNDVNYVYVACQVIGASLDLSCTEQGMLWAHPQFAFTLAKYDAATVCPVITFQGNEYEQYTFYQLGFVNGKPFSSCRSQGMSTYELGETDFNIRYDSSTRTYNYEARIQYDYTNLSLFENPYAVMAFDITDAHKGDAGNRYIISQAAEQANAWMGPNNFAHRRTNPLIIELNGPYVLDIGKYEPIIDEENAPGTLAHAPAAKYTPPSGGGGGVDWKMIGIIGGGAVVIVAAAVVGFIVVKRRKNKENPAQTE